MYKIGDTHSSYGSCAQRLRVFQTWTSSAHHRAVAQRISGSKIKKTVS